MNRTFVIGDIHGAHPSLLRCFEAAGFEPASDRLICLGDACDGWPGVAEVMETLASLKDLVYILGNHDQWALEWMQTGIASPSWLFQGGRACLDAYPRGMPEHHRRLLEEATLYHTEENRLFVHGGMIPGLAMEEQGEETFLWDRNTVKQAVALEQSGTSKNLSGYTEVFVGHTPTLIFGSTFPMHACEFRLMDTGAGWDGPLSMMDIHTGEVFQGPPASQFYPESSGRMG